MPLCTIQGGSGFGDVWLTTSGPSYTLDTSHPHLLALPTRTKPTPHPPPGTPPSLQARSISENQRGETLTADIAASLNSGGGKPGQGYPAVMTRIAASQGDLDHATAQSAAPTGPTTPAADVVQHAPVVAGAKACSHKGSDSTVDDDGGMAIRTQHCQVAAGANSRVPGQPGSGGDPAPVTVRQLTPRECERLQGFPDDWTALDDNGQPISDATRYRAIGNTVAVPVIAWIGRRLLAADHRHVHASCRRCRSNPTPLSTTDAEDSRA